MATRKDTYLRRAVEDFEAARQLLIAKGYGDPVDIDHAAAVVVLAARLEAVEDAITNGLPTAGEGI